MSFFSEFKKFLIRGNVVDMAVGFMFGAAFSTVVQSLVNNIVMPPIGMLLGKVDFSNLFIALDGNSYESLDALNKAGAPAIKLGIFVNDTISFLILGTIMFLVVKSYNRLREEPEVTEKVCSQCAMKIPLAAKKCPYCLDTSI